ncbi:MAG: bifunctional metallophosphatase/5'-nucleotidase [Roseburia sp.]
MKKRLKNLALLMASVMLLGGLGGVPVRAEEQSKSVDIMFLSDTHSHLDSFMTVVDGESKEVGGFARINTLIKEQKEKNPETLLIDGGDFSMGTLVQTVYEEEAAELRMLGYLGFDVTTFGNHEFDYRSKGIANMLDTAAASGEELPELVVCNVDWDAMEKEGLTEDQQLLKDAFENYGVKDYTIVEKDGVKIALIGVFGEDALACAPTCALLFRDASEAVKETIEEIKATEDVDMYVCVSHSGTNQEDESKSEDEILAKAVPELDLIVSGHTHTVLEEPIQHGDTYIVSPGEYGKYLGSFSMTQKEDGRWNLEDYQLIPITDEIEKDEPTQQKIDSFMEAVDEIYLAQFGYTKDQVLATNDIEFCSLSDLETRHTELNLGDIMSDAYIYAVENADDYDGETVQIAVVPAGTIRDTYAVGDITVTDVFNSFSLGTGEDGIPGYPLVSVYLTGKELKIAAEIDASVSELMPTARLYMSGLNFTYNPNRMILNRVTDAYLVDEDGNRIEIEDDKLYRVVADLYSGQMLSAVTDMSYGLLSLVPKNADGTEITDFSDVIIYENGKELKAWDAIARYMASFEDTDGDGIANVPEYYSENHNRKVVDESTNFSARLSNPNKFVAMIVGAVVLLILLLVLLIVIIVKIVKHIRKRKRK